jgi:prevent-host-death family protein
MTTFGIAELRNNLGEAVNRAAYGGERVVLTRRGKGVVALVSLDDLALLEALEDQEDLRAALKARKEPGAVPLAKVKARLGMK